MVVRAGMLWEAKIPQPSRSLSVEGHISTETEQLFWSGLWEYLQPGRDPHIAAGLYLYNLLHSCQAPPWRRRHRRNDQTFRGDAICVWSTDLVCREIFDFWL